MAATDFAGATTDWTPVGTWSVNLPAVAVAVSPNGGSGASQVFGYTISDPNGAADISSVRLLLSGVPSLVSACMVRVNPATAQLYLGNDAGTSDVGPIAIGGPDSLSNSQCRVNAATSAMGTSGNLLFLQISLDFQPAFAGIEVSSRGGRRQRRQQRQRVLPDRHLDRPVNRAGMHLRPEFRPPCRCRVKAAFSSPQ